MDTNRLRYFCTIAETKSIRNSAELLRISPAALSKAVKTLEAEVGYPLLIREGRGILVTDRGARLAQKAKPILQQLNRLREDSESESSSSVVLRLGSFEVFTTHFLGPLL